MSAPLLHNRVRDSIEIADSPAQVIEKLKALLGEHFNFELDETDYDNIQFEMTGINSEIIIHGVIRRWQGTESRLDFMGEVNISASNTRLQQTLFTLIMIMIALILFEIVIFDSIRILPLRTIFELFGLLIMWLIPTALASLVIYPLVVRDRTGARRWKVQQELAGFIERIRTMQTDA